jgi:uncharacterized membrane protein
MIDKIHIYITILAAAVITTVGIITGMSLADTALRLVGVIIVFYILGSIARALLRKYLTPAPEAADEEPSEDEEQTEEAEAEVINV